MASDNEAYFAAIKEAHIGSCDSGRAFNEDEYAAWSAALTGARKDGTDAER
ncbi:hypothetical protein [Nocardia sp. Marseille-Q1738]